MAIIRNKKKNLDPAQRAYLLLDALMKSNLPPEMEELLREWFRTPGNMGGKAAALERVMEIYVKEEKNPDLEDYEAFGELCRLLGIDRNKYLEKRSEQEKQGKVKKVPLHRPKIWRIAMAAIPILMIAGGAGLLVKRAVDTTESHPIAQVVVTPEKTVVADTVKRIDLPDGSTVWLNPDSEIFYEENFVEDRKIRLKGEAYFAVAGTGAPFEVKTKSLTVAVMGTEFRLKDYEDEKPTELVLTQGKVKVTTVANESVELSPSERLLLDKLTGRIEIDTVEVESKKPVQVHSLEFRDTPMDEALKSIARYYRKEIEIAPGTRLDELLNARFTGRESLDEILLMINELSSGFFYVVTTDRLLISPAAR